MDMIAWLPGPKAPSAPTIAGIIGQWIAVFLDLRIQRAISIVRCRTRTFTTEGIHTRIRTIAAGGRRITRRGRILEWKTMVVKDHVQLLTIHKMAERTRVRLMVSKLAATKEPMATSTDDRS